MTPQRIPINPRKIDDFCTNLQPWLTAHVASEPLELLHAAIALEQVARRLKSQASALASKPAGFMSGSLLQQSLNRKVELARCLRSLLKAYTDWVGGEVLAVLSETVAELEGEIEELAQGQESVIPGLERLLERSPDCPMGHTCTKQPCAHQHLCREVADDH